MRLGSKDMVPRPRTRVQAFFLCFQGLFWQTHSDNVAFKRVKAASLTFPPRAHHPWRPHIRCIFLPKFSVGPCGTSAPWLRCFNCLQRLVWASDGALSQPSMPSVVVVTSTIASCKPRCRSWWLAWCSRLFWGDSWARASLQDIRCTTCLPVCRQRKASALGAFAPLPCPHCQEPWLHWPASFFPCRERSSLLGPTKATQSIWMLFLPPMVLLWHPLWSCSEMHAWNCAGSLVVRRCASFFAFLRWRMFRGPFVLRSTLDRGQPYERCPSPPKPRNPRGSSWTPSSRAPGPISLTWPKTSRSTFGNLPGKSCKVPVCGVKARLCSDKPPFEPSSLQSERLLWPVRLTFFSTWGLSPLSGPTTRTARPYSTSWSATWQLRFLALVFWATLLPSSKLASPTTAVLTQPMCSVTHLPRLPVNQPFLMSMKLFYAHVWPSSMPGAGLCMLLWALPPMRHPDREACAESLHLFFFWLHPFSALSTKPTPGSGGCGSEASYLLCLNQSPALSTKPTAGQTRGRKKTNAQKGSCCFPMSQLPFPRRWCSHVAVETCNRASTQFRKTHFRSFGCFNFLHSHMKTCDGVRWAKFEKVEQAPPQSRLCFRTSFTASASARNRNRACPVVECL